MYALYFESFICLNTTRLTWNQLLTIQSQTPSVFGELGSCHWVHLWFHCGTNRDILLNWFLNEAPSHSLPCSQGRRKHRTSGWHHDNLSGGTIVSLGGLKIIYTPKSTFRQVKRIRIPVFMLETTFENLQWKATWSEATACCACLTEDIACELLVKSKSRKLCSQVEKGTCCTKSALPTRFKSAVSYWYWCSGRFRSETNFAVALGIFWAQRWVHRRHYVVKSLYNNTRRVWQITTKSNI